MTKSKILQLRTAQKVKSISKKFTLLQMLAMLENKKIAIHGDVRNESKKEILSKSLKFASDPQLNGFLQEAGTNVEENTNRPILSGIKVLHPLFRNSKVEKFFDQGEYEESIRVLFIRINNRVKQRSGLKSDGAPLMRLAFSPNNPVIPLNNLSSDEDRDEQEGLMHIFEGCMLAFRNPPSHNDELSMSKEDAERILGLGNYLMGLLDRRTVQNNSKG